LWQGDLDDAEYRQVIEHVGPGGLFELLTLVGYYVTLALQLRVFRVPSRTPHPPPDRHPPQPLTAGPRAG